jgi:hypothetical protein
MDEETFAISRALPPDLRESRQVGERQRRIHSPQHALVRFNAPMGARLVPTNVLVKEPIADFQDVFGIIALGAAC